MPTDITTMRLPAPHTTTHYHRKHHHILSIPPHYHNHTSDIITRHRTSKHHHTSEHHPTSDHHHLSGPLFLRRHHRTRCLLPLSEGRQRLLHLLGRLLIALGLQPRGGSDELSDREGALQELFGLLGLPPGPLKHPQLLYGGHRARAVDQPFLVHFDNALVALRCEDVLPPLRVSVDSVGVMSGEYCWVVEVQIKS